MQKGLCMDLETEINTEQKIAEYLDVTLACLRDWRSRKVGPLISSWADLSATGAKMSCRGWNRKPRDRDIQKITNGPSPSCSSPYKGVSEFVVLAERVESK